MELEWIFGSMERFAERTAHKERRFALNLLAFALLHRRLVRAPSLAACRMSTRSRRAGLLAERLPEGSGPGIW